MRRKTSQFSSLRTSNSQGSFPLTFLIAHWICLIIPWLNGAQSIFSTFRQAVFIFIRHLFLWVAISTFPWGSDSTPPDHPYLYFIRLIDHSHIKSRGIVTKSAPQIFMTLPSGRALALNYWILRCLITKHLFWLWLRQSFFGWPSGFTMSFLFGLLWLSLRKRLASITHLLMMFDALGFRSWKVILISTSI